MPDLFVYGTLCDHELLENVLGRHVTASEVCLGEFKDHTVHWVQDQNYPVIIPHVGSTAKGHVLTGLSQEDLAKLDYYEGGFGYFTQDVSISTQSGTLSALVYFSDHQDVALGAKWELARWQNVWGPMARSASLEFMSAFGTTPSKNLIPYFNMMQVRAHSRILGQTDPRLRAERGPSDQAIEIQSHRRPYSKFFALEEFSLRHSTYVGAMSPVMERAVFVSGDASIVLPYDPVRDRVLLVEQFRMGPFARTDAMPWCLEPIAGRVDAGEDPEATALREAKEEANLDIMALHHVSSAYSSPGSTSEVFHLYVGIADLPDDIVQIGGEASEDEDILSRLFSYEELMQMADKNQLLALPTLTVALWLARHKQKLQNTAV